MTFKHAALAIAASLVSVSALAVPITSTTNTRPVDVAPHNAEVQLDRVLDEQFGPGPHAQSPAGVFRFSGGFGTAAPTLVLEQTAGFATQRLGVWFGNDTDNLLRFDIFRGAASVGPNGDTFPGGGPGEGTTTSLRISGNTLQIGGSGLPPEFYSCSDSYTEVNFCTATDDRISENFFGFYFQSNTNAPVYHTLDLLNPQGAARVLAFNGSGPTAGAWIFAFEDGGGQDFNAMVVKVESLQAAPAAVPLPGTVALLGAGLLGIGLLRQRRR